MILKAESLGITPEPADHAAGGHLHVALRQINDAITQATEIRMNPWGRQVDLETLRVYAHTSRESGRGLADIFASAMSGSPEQAHS